MVLPEEISREESGLFAIKWAAEILGLLQISKNHSFPQSETIASYLYSADLSLSDPSRCSLFNSNSCPLSNADNLNFLSNFDATSESDKELLLLFSDAMQTAFNREYRNYFKSFLCRCRNQFNMALGDDVILQIFDEDLKRLIDREFQYLKTVGELNNPTSINEKFWRYGNFNTLRLRILGRDGWDQIIQNELNEIGVCENSIRTGLSDVGPLYNALDNNGIPIPATSISPSYKYEKGLSRITGIEFHNGKPIVLGEATSDDSPPLVFLSDINVALALVFASEDAVIPSFSLDDGSTWKGGTKADGRMILQYQNYFPNWLSVTDFGKSLFYADYLMQQVIGLQNAPIQSLKDYRLSVPSRQYTENHWKNNEHEFLSSLEETNGRYIPNQVGARFCISLSDVTYSEPTYGKIIYETGAVYIESSAKVRNSDGSLNNFANLNDIETAHGRSAANFTENYAVLGAMFPVFLRIEQLLIMFQLLKTMRGKGFSLSKGHHLDLVNLIAVAKSEAANNVGFAPMTYHRYGCKCAGTWPSTDDKFVLTDEQRIEASILFRDNQIWV